MDENGTEADNGEEDEVLDEGRKEIVFLVGFHGGAAEFDDNGLAAELLDKG